MNIVAEIRRLAARLMESQGPIIGGPGPNQVAASSLFLMAHDIEASQGRPPAPKDWHCAICHCWIADPMTAVYVAEGSGIAHPTCVQSPEPSHTMTELSQDEALDMLDKLRPRGSENEP